MKAKRLSRQDPPTMVVVFESGDTVVEGLLEVAQEWRLRGSHFTAIGALQEVTLGYWDPGRKDYSRIHLPEQVEVLSLVGNIAQDPDGKPKLHAHVVVGKSDGTAHGGHLLQARVRPTLEVVIVESPEHLQRRLDPETGLTLISL
jgi:predicted DNA-binding protein with PD1-like motif